MKKTLFYITLVALLLAGGLWTYAKLRQQSLLNHEKPLSELLEEYPAAEYWIKVDKSEYVLTFMADEVAVKQYKIVLGGNPVDDKRMQGDQCTPEGTFKIRSKYPHKSWSKFIWVDYPNAESWKKFKAAKAAGEIPETAKIGGEIGIHGVPKGSDTVVELGYNWTLGCICLANENVDEIYPHLKKGSRIVIKK
ncbi:MAG: L,D-transpeptidase [Bacteroidota bacterium]